MDKTGALEGYRLVIFDADDTLRRTTTPGKPCPHRPGEWALMPGVREVLGSIRWNQLGAPCLGIASNQDQVAYGHLSLGTARSLLRDLARSAADFVPADAAIRLCPHALTADCNCRKPKPGMLLDIMRYYDVAPRETLFVGNDEVDRQTAERAGADFRWSHVVFGQQQ
jgi:D-glycero-D-manno-heptose 1,7-bisphosphate phosphatase